MEIFNPEKAKPKKYLPEVRTIIDIINNEGKKEEDKNFLKNREKDLTSMSEKKETLRHSQRMTNLGYLLAKKMNFSDEETKFFVEACLLHDIGKTAVPRKYLGKPSKKFSDKDLKVVSEHSVLGYKYLKDKGRNSRVYNPILLHHEFQTRPYPHTKASILRILGAMDDTDIDNGRLLAIIDNFDTQAFGRSYVDIKSAPLGEVKKWIQVEAGFNQPGDEEIIDFLCDQYEKIKELS
ncbi:MAG TPA: HD domain-containing protein [Candidatus Saccharimonadales bacterium]|nr:HD domain-containing protein [Candidatus Saccharimonadales bacterium]